MPYSAPSMSSFAIVTSFKTADRCLFGTVICFLPFRVGSFARCIRKNNGTLKDIPGHSGTFPGKLRLIYKNDPGNFRDISKIFRRYIGETSGKMLGRVQYLSNIFSTNLRESSRKTYHCFLEKPQTLPCVTVQVWLPELVPLLTYKVVVFALLIVTVERQVSTFIASICIVLACCALHPPCLPPPS
jgi:hypothetical protein